MTRTDLYETASERYSLLDRKLRCAAGIREQHVLRLEILNVLDVYMHILTRMKYLE